MVTKSGSGRLLLIILISIILVGVFMYLAQHDKIILHPPGQRVACTMEAKICPDGRSVGRVGPNCEFAPCPGK